MKKNFEKECSNALRTLVLLYCTARDSQSSEVLNRSLIDLLLPEVPRSKECVLRGWST